MMGFLIVLSVDETDMKELEQSVRSITMDGLLWGASKLVPLAYGIKKLQISSVVEDDKVCVSNKCLLRVVLILTSQQLEI